MSEWLSLIFRYKEKKTSDKLGKYPSNIHTLAFPERRYLWTSRLLVICAAISCSFTIIFTMTIFLLLPQRGARPLLLEKDNLYQSLKEISPMEISTTAQELLEENAVRLYVILRHEFIANYSKMSKRWQRGSEFYHLSGNVEYSKFMQSANYNMFSKLIASGMERKVKIERAEKLKRNLWMVQFSTSTTPKKSPKPNIAYWRAYIRFIFKPLKEGDTISSVNPLQIKITNYNLSSLGKDDNKNQESYLETAKSISSPTETQGE